MRVSLMRKLWKGGNMSNVLKIRCQVCEEVKDEEEFYVNKTSFLGRNKRCKACYVNIHLEKNYGISLEDYNKMLKEQGGTSANKACDYGLDDDHKLFVDHCHETGIIRGLLCNWCNSAEGYLKGSPEVAEGLIKYMRKHNGKRS